MAKQQDWLAGYELLSLGDFELTPELDQDLSIHALAAQQDPRDCQALFIMLATKIARFTSRYQRWDHAAWEYDDVVQETWIAFTDVVQDWRPLRGNGPPAGFGYYFLSVFTFRLRDRLRALEGATRSQPAWASLHCDPETLVTAADVEECTTTGPLLEQICGRLNAVDASILRHRVSGMEFEPAQLRVSGITASRATVYRRWKRIVRIAGDVLTERASS